MQKEYTAQETELADIRRKAGALKKVREKEKADRHFVLEARYELFYEAQEVANQFLESAFIEARLLAPRPEKAADTPAPLRPFKYYRDNHGQPVFKANGTCRGPDVPSEQRCNEGSPAASRPGPVEPVHEERR